MNGLIKHSLVVALGFSLGLTVLPATAVGLEQTLDAIFRTNDLKSDLQELQHRTGIRAGTRSVPLDYYVDSNVRRVFERNKDLRIRMPRELPNDFNSVIQDIQQYIDEKASRNTEDANEISHRELAKKIVRISFCFGTDPKMSAAKIHMESVFLSTAVSPTGAVGLSQMTGIAIEEVNDQLGNRGNDHAPRANTDYFRQAIRCYLGKDLKYPWTVGVTTAGKTMTRAEVTKAKNWLKKDIDRDLIYGHVVLKVNLAATRSDSKNRSDNYAKAFVRYNGDNAKVGKTLRKHVYSRAVMGYFENINYRPEQDPLLLVPFDSSPAVESSTPKLYEI